MHDSDLLKVAEDSGCQANGRDDQGTHGYAIAMYKKSSPIASTTI